MHKLGRRHSARRCRRRTASYFPADNGDTYVFAGANVSEVLAKNPLGEECYASPAIAEGCLFVRTTQHLLLHRNVGKSEEVVAADAGKA